MNYYEFITKLVRETYGNNAMQKQILVRDELGESGYYEIISIEYDENYDAIVINTGKQLDD